MLVGASADLLGGILVICSLLVNVAVVMDRSSSSRYEKGQKTRLTFFFDATRINAMKHAVYES